MRMYNFVRSRQLEGTYSADPGIGAWVVTSFRVMKGWGVPDEADWPYDGDASYWPPTEPPSIDERAKRNRVGVYQRVSSIDDCRFMLASELPVCVALCIDEGWFDTSDGVIQIPNDEPNLGHAVLLVGYDDVAQRFAFRNSWGVAWGDHGYGYILYEYFEHYQQEAWALILARWILFRTTAVELFSVLGGYPSRWAASFTE